MSFMSVECILPLPFNSVCVPLTCPQIHGLCFLVIVTNTPPNTHTCTHTQTRAHKHTYNDKHNLWR